MCGGWGPVKTYFEDIVSEQCFPSTSRVPLPLKKSKLFYCSTLKWWWWWWQKFSDGGLVVLLWSWCGALLTKASEREQILGQWREVWLLQLHTLVYTPAHSLNLYTLHTLHTFWYQRYVHLKPSCGQQCPPPHTRAQMCSPNTLRHIPSFNYIPGSMFGVFLLVFFSSQFSLASFSCLKELSETVWEYCVLVLTVLPLSICRTHGFYHERHSSNCVTTNVLQN